MLTVITIVDFCQSYVGQHVSFWRFSPLYLLSCHARFSFCSELHHKSLNFPAESKLIGSKSVVEENAGQIRNAEDEFVFPLLKTKENILLRVMDQEYYSRHLIKEVISIVHHNSRKYRREYLKCLLLYSKSLRPNNNFTFLIND